MTEGQTREETTNADDRDATMAAVDHTHPHTDEPFGEPFRGGSIPPADGEGSETAEEAEGDAPEIRTDGGTHADPERDDRPTRTMAEVDHAGTVDVSTAFERGRVRPEDPE